MNAQDYIDKHKSDIKYLAEIECILEELRPLRFDNRRTEKYHSEKLTADWRYKQYSEDRIEDQLNGLDVSNIVFSSNIGEIKIDIAPSVRRQLLDVVKADETFGYIYFLLQSEQNRIIKGFAVECVPDKNKIDLALLWEGQEDLWKNTIALIEPLDISEKICYLVEQKTSWRQNVKSDAIQLGVCSYGEKCDLEIEKLRIQKPKEPSSNNAVKTLPTIVVPAKKNDFLIAASNFKETKITDSWNSKQVQAFYSILHRSFLIKNDNTYNEVLRQMNEYFDTGGETKYKPSQLKKTEDALTKYYWIDTIQLRKKTDR
jgi:hypothetical protein